MWKQNGRQDVGASKSSPSYDSGSPVTRTSAYAKQSPKFKAAGCLPLPKRRHARRAAASCSAVTGAGSVPAARGMRPAPRQPPRPTRCTREGRNGYCDKGPVQSPSAVCTSLWRNIFTTLLVVPVGEWMRLRNGQTGLLGELCPDCVRGWRHELRSGRRCRSPRNPGPGRGRSTPCKAGSPRADSRQEDPGQRTQAKRGPVLASMKIRSRCTAGFVPAGVLAWQRPVRTPSWKAFSERRLHG